MPSQPPSSLPTVSTVYILFSPYHNFSGIKEKTTTTTVAITKTGSTTLRFLHWWFFQNTKSTPWRQDSTHVYSAQILGVTRKITETGGLIAQFISRGHVKSVTNSGLCLLCAHVHVQCCITFVASQEHSHEFHSVIFPANSPEPCTTNHIHDNSMSVFLTCFQCMLTAKTAL